MTEEPTERANLNVEQQAAQLLIAISRCPNIASCFTNPGLLHPCAEIVNSQEATTIDDFQVPEPWSGRIATAPILFVSSNPSISGSEEYPRLGWSDTRIIDYFQNRFEGGEEEWVRGGLRVLMQDGSYGRHWVRYWAWARRRATELIGRPAVPGVDYALTEVVRCKSLAERGVRSASRECPEFYLERTLAVSPAKVIIVVGTEAAREIRRLYGVAVDAEMPFERVMGKRMRSVVVVPHSNARTAKSITNVLSENAITRLRSMILQSETRDGA